MPADLTEWQRPSVRFSTKGGSDAAKLFPLITAGRRRLGRPISNLDAQIVAIARSHDVMLATRITSDFEDCGVSLVNPWLAL